MPAKSDILDLYFLDARHKLLEIAAFLDRVDRHHGESDFRHAAFLEALDAVINPGNRPRARAVLEVLSDPSTDPIEKAPVQFAHGAPPPAPPGP